MTSAAKPNRRPPFTTLATRLMLTSFSANSLSSRSRCWPSPPSRLRRSPCVRAIAVLSEIEPALAGGIGQGLDPAMIHIGTAIEYDARGPRRLGALGDQLADRAGRRLVRAGLQFAAQPLVERRGRRQRMSGSVVDHLGIDMARAAVHRQAGAPLRCLPQLEARAFAAPPEQRLLFVRHFIRPLYSPLGLLLLAFLAADRLVAVLDPLALVRLG